MPGVGGPAWAEAPESAVKAIYLYKFAPFVEWPASAFPSRSSPFYFCVLGDDPFAVLLNQAVAGQLVDEHPVAVRRLRPEQDGAGCHVLYLDGQGGKVTADALRTVRGAPVLTVADQNPDGVRGAIIEFVVKNGHVHFNIDTTAATTNGVTISSKLLSLAQSAGPGG